MSSSNQLELVVRVCDVTAKTSRDVDVAGSDEGEVNDWSTTESCIQFIMCVNSTKSGSNARNSTFLYMHVHMYVYMYTYMYVHVNIRWPQNIIRTRLLE